MKPSSRKPKIIIFSGAGLSAESGIRTYRREDGLYNGMAAEKIMSGKTLRQAPEIIHNFCDDRRVELANVEPNEAHKMIRRLEQRYGAQLIHLTQNIDDLMEREGTERTFHLHGELRVVRSIGNHLIEFDIGHRRYWSGDESVMPEAGFKFRCPRSGSLFRPAVVLFGETAPLYRTLYSVMGKIRRDDLLIVIGTQGSVININLFAALAPCAKILNNLHDSEYIDPLHFHRYLKTTAVNAAPEIEEIAIKHMAKHGL